MLSWLNQKGHQILAGKALGGCIEKRSERRRRRRWIIIKLAARLLCNTGQINLVRTGLSLCHLRPVGGDSGHDDPSPLCLTNCGVYEAIVGNFVLISECCISAV